MRPFGSFAPARQLRRDEENRWIHPEANPPPLSQLQSGFVLGHSLVNDGVCRAARFAQIQGHPTDLREHSPTATALLVPDALRNFGEAAVHARNLSLRDRPLTMPATFYAPRFLEHRLAVCALLSSPRSTDFGHLRERPLLKPAKLTTSPSILKRNRSFNLEQASESLSL